MVISLIFCFFNSEVKNEIRKLIERKILEYDPNKTNRLSRFLLLKRQDKNSNESELNNHINDIKISNSKIYYNNNSPRLTISTTKSRNSSEFFTHLKKKSNISTTNTEITAINNLDTKKSNFLNFLQKKHQHETNEFDEIIKIKQKKMTKKDSLKIIKNYTMLKQKIPTKQPEDLQNYDINQIEIVNDENNQLDNDILTCKKEKRFLHSSFLSIDNIDDCEDMCEFK